MPRDPDCLFCKLAAAEVPAALVLETDRAIAFLDLHPVNKGHVLVIPKDHYASLPDLPADLGAHLGGLLPKLALAVRSASGADGLNAIVNVGEAAGQTIEHVHWHLIPRSRGDEVRWPWPHQSYQGDEMERTRAAIAALLA